MQPERPIFCTLVALMLGGCVAETDNSTETACGADAYSAFVGRPVAAISLPDTKNHRIIGPGDAVTMDYVAGRLNILVDETGVIERLYCG